MSLYKHSLLPAPRDRYQGACGARRFSHRLSAREGSSCRARMSWEQMLLPPTFPSAPSVPRAASHTCSALLTRTAQAAFSPDGKGQRRAVLATALILLEDNEREKDHEFSVVSRAHPSTNTFSAASAPGTVLGTMWFEPDAVACPQGGSGWWGASSACGHAGGL